MDCIFKTLLGSKENKHLLIHFLNCFVVEESDPPIVDVELLDPYHIKMHLKDKRGIVDVKALNKLGDVFQVEMQNGIPPDFINRLLHSWSKISAAGLTEGEFYLK